jgi:Ca-activated chloride channel family protein
VRWQVCAAIATVALLAGCARPPPFRLVAGSEQRSLAPLVQTFCAARHVRCEIDYRSPVDIGQMLAAPTPPAVDAVWPASGLWVALYDTHHRVQDQKPIISTPVVLGVRSDLAHQLGWVGRPVSLADIAAAVQARRLTSLAPSAARSSTGALAYLEMVGGVLSPGAALDRQGLDDPATQGKLRVLLSGVSRSSGSSTWLKDLYLATAKSGAPYPAMWATEAQLKETNDGLQRERRTLLYAIYPAEGVAYADAPLGFVARGQAPAVHGFFRDLQAYLLTPEVQGRMARQGRRPVVAGVAGLAPEPGWNFDPARAARPLALPAPDVTAHALDLYQQTLRRPSVTAYCLDVSGSMRGAPEAELKAAMGAVLDPALAAASLTQWTAQDRILLLPYDDKVRAVTVGDGSPAALARLLASVRAQESKGNGDFYACAERAIGALRPWLGKGYLPAVVVMTDGRAKGRDRFEKFWRKAGAGVPVFAISYGKADKRDLEGLAGLTQARVFDGAPDLAEAFRAQRAYN